MSKKQNQPQVPGRKGGFSNRQPEKVNRYEPKPQSKEQVQEQSADIKQKTSQEATDRRLRYLEQLQPTLEIVTTPVFRQFGLEVIDYIKKYWLSSQKYYKNREHLGGEKGRVAKLNLEEMKNRFDYIEGIEWFLVNYGQYSDQSHSAQAAYNLHLMCEMSNVLSIALISTGRNVGFDILFPGFPANQRNLMFQVCLGLLEAQVRLHQLEYVLPDYPDLIHYEENINNIKIEYYLQFADFMNGMIEVKDHTESTNKKSFSSVVHTTSEIIDMVYQTALKIRGNLPTPDKRNELLEKLPIRLKEVLELLATPKTQVIKSEILYSQELNEAEIDYEQIIGLQLIRDIKKYSLPKLYNLQTVLLTEEPNGFWSDLLDAISDQTVVAIQPSQIPYHVRSKLIATLQSELITKLNKLIEYPEDDYNLNDFIGGEVLAVVEEESIDQKELFSSLVNLDSNPTDTKLVTFMLNLQKRIGVPLLNSTFGEYEFTNWFKYFAEIIKQSLVSKTTLDFQTVSELIADPEINQKVHFQIAQNPYIDLIDSGDPKLQRLLIQRLQSIADCGSLGMFRKASASNMTLGFGWHLAKRDQVWCSKGDMLIDCGAANRLVLGEQGNQIIIRAVVDYHDLNY